MVKWSEAEKKEGQTAKEGEKVCASPDTTLICWVEERAGGRAVGWDFMYDPHLIKRLKWKNEKQISYEWQ